MSEDSEDESFVSSEHSCFGTSCRYDDIEWLEHIATDGSLLFIESYVSSTVKEKQFLALKSSREKKSNKNGPFLLESLKKENKLLSLLRRRPSIRSKRSEKSSLSIADSKDPGQLKGEQSAANQKVKGRTVPRDSSPAPKVTFRDNKSGEIRTVALHVVTVGDGRAGLCEAVLGVVAGRFSEPPTDRIMVAGILPGSEAYTTHAIKIGDWLKEINRTEVNWENIDIVLGEIRVPSVVTLGLQKCASETLSDQDHKNRKRLTQTRLVEYISGNSLTPDSDSSCFDLVKGSPPHVALLLSLEGVNESSQEGADILYQFPVGSSRLVRVRGVFLTLAYSLFDLNGEESGSCTIVLGDKETVHVAYHKQNDLVWIIALPHTHCTEYELLSLNRILIEHFKFEFGSLEKSVGTPSNHHSIHLLLSKVFSVSLSSSCLSSAPPSHYLHPNNCLLLPVEGERRGGQHYILSAPPWLMLHDARGVAKMEIENCLSELEAGDFGSENDSDCEDCGALIHSIQGCCLFYKGSVVSSHLPESLLQSVYQYCQLHGLLAMITREAVSQLLCWKKVTYIDSFEDETPSRKLLLVAADHLLLAMVQYDESQSHRCYRGGPDPFIVDQVEATLFHLQSLKISELCEMSLSNGGPEVTLADDVFSETKRGPKRENAEGCAVPEEVYLDVPSILKQTRAPPIAEENEEQMVYSQPATLVGEEEEMGDESNLSTSSVSTSLPNLPVKTIRVTTGPSPALFHLLHLDVGEGVVVESLPPPGCPVHALVHHISPDCVCGTPVHSNVIRNFRTAASRLHETLHSDLYAMLCEGTTDEVREQGLLFNITHNTSVLSKKKNTFNYWVVGRIMPTSQREVYVCYHENVPQNLQEMASKLSLGAFI